MPAAAPHFACGRKRPVSAAFPASAAANPEALDARATAQGRPSCLEKRRTLCALQGPTAAFRPPCSGSALRAVQSRRCERTRLNTRTLGLRANRRRRFELRICPTHSSSSRYCVHSGGTPRSHTAPALPGGTLFVPSTLENAVPVLSLLTCVTACFSAAWDSSRTGVGPLDSDLSLGDLQCFIGSCKAHCRSLRMASFSKEHDRNVFSCRFYCVKWRPQNPAPAQD